MENLKGKNKLTGQQFMVETQTCVFEGEINTPGNAYTMLTYRNPKTGIRYRNTRDNMTGRNSYWIL